MPEQEKDQRELWQIRRNNRLRFMDTVFAYALAENKAKEQVNLRKIRKVG